MKNRFITHIPGAPERLSVRVAWYMVFAFLILATLALIVIGLRNEDAFISIIFGFAVGCASILYFDSQRIQLEGTIIRRQPRILRFLRKELDLAEVKSYRYFYSKSQKTTLVVSDGVKELQIPLECYDLDFLQSWIEMHLGEPRR